MARSAFQPGRVAALLLATFALQSAALRAEMRSSANPIRRVVTMLQMMEKKVQAEGEKEQELFDKFMTYCNGGEAQLQKSVDAAEEKIPQLESSIKESTEAQTQLAQDLVTHAEDRTEAKAAIAKATAVREKEAAAFAAESAEQKANIESLDKAIPAIEKGMGAAFLQSAGGEKFRTFFSASNSITDSLTSTDHEMLEAFLSQDQSQGYEPASGEILGIMKQMKEEMVKDLAEMTQEEENAIADFNALVSAKEKEIAAATKAIEEKTKRKGEVSVEIVNLKEDLDDTSKSLAEDKDMLANLDKTCAAKKKEFEATSKTRKEELLALADTIKMLNDDDALDLFKKTLPSASAFVDVGISAKEVRRQAVDTLRGALGRGTRDYRLNYLALAIRGKKVGFEKVLTMVDDMVTLLGKEQAEDDDKKAYCEKEFDKTDDEIKALKDTISDLEAAIEEQQESLANLDEELKAIAQGLADLDQDVAKATEQRKEENAEFTEALASNNAALQLIEMAKNRLNKFYNPKLYKAPPKRELTEEERITLNMGGTLAPTNPPGGIAGTGISALQDAPVFAQVRTHIAVRAANVKQEATGVIAMMDTLKADLNKEIQEMEFTEKDAQEDYTKLVNEAAEKRATDLKAAEQKQAARAELQDELHKLNKNKVTQGQELQALMMYLADLHKECDWLLQNYGTRKEARANEVDALKKAKAVLSGADYSLMQTGVRHHLRRARA